MNLITQVPHVTQSHGRSTLVATFLRSSNILLFERHHEIEEHVLYINSASLKKMTEWGLEPVAVTMVGNLRERAQEVTQALVECNVVKINQS